MKKITIFLVLIFICLPISNVFAQEDVSDTQDKLQAYKHVMQIDNLDLKVPTVLELPLNNSFNKHHDFAILEVESDDFQPFYFNTVAEDIPVDVLSILSSNNMDSLHDNNRKTFVDFPLKSDKIESIDLLINAHEEITSSSLLTQLDRYTALPLSIEVSVIEGENKNIVFTNDHIKSQVIFFPKTTAKKWNVHYEYSQPLRITELELIQERNKKDLENGLRFLARPNMTYKIYYDSDRDSNIKVLEAGNLRDDKEIENLDFVDFEDNPFYVKSDFDDDGIPDDIDNCVKVANSNQRDVNGNKRGDLCDDFDRDSILNFEDNCPGTPNYKQLDVDNDGFGDACDDHESRITENKPWLPWLAISFVILVVLLLLIRTAKK